MAYQVIARKYRPQRFADVVGQEHVTQTLANAIAQKRIAHAYLFVGPRGTGKTTIARIFAKCLNCDGGPKVDFAADDPRCIEIGEGRSLDVLEIDGASNRGIEEVRELRETVKYAPATARFKIYIIDEVHMLTKEAFNALLKTLEEPPAHVKFMFATTEPEKVLPTIVSRCQRFDLRRIPIPLIVKHLRYVASEEQVDIENAALLAIARGAEGCMRDAESTLDQLISFCGARIVEGDVLSMFGLTARGQVHATARAILEGDASRVLHHLDELVKNGKDLSRLLTDLLDHFRNLLIFKYAQGDPSALEVIEADAAALADQAERVSTPGLTRILDLLVACESRMRDSVSKRIALEVGLLKAVEARNAVPVDDLLQRLRVMRSGSDPNPPGEVLAAPGRADPRKAPASGEARTRPSRRPPPDPAASEPQTPAAPAPAPPSDDLQVLWQDLLERVGKTSPFVRGYLVQTSPVSWENRRLTIGYRPELADQIELLDSPRNRNLVVAKLKEITAGDCQVKFAKLEHPPAGPAPATLTGSNPDAPAAPAPAGEPVPSPAGRVRAAAESRTEKSPSAPLNPEEFKNDPLIKQALEVFKGQIAGIQPR
jgi:DNA polymerase-3 subunit gamma/tau